VEGPEV
jgi:hypothetical protein